MRPWEASATPIASSHREINRSRTASTTCPKSDETDRRAVELHQPRSHARKRTGWTAFFPHGANRTETARARRDSAPENLALPMLMPLRGTVARVQELMDTYKTQLSEHVRTAPKGRDEVEQSCGIGPGHSRSIVA